MSAAMDADISGRAVRALPAAEASAFQLSPRSPRRTRRFFRSCGGPPRLANCAPVALGLVRLTQLAAPCTASEVSEPSWLRSVTNPRHGRPGGLPVGLMSRDCDEAATHRSTRQI